MYGDFGYFGASYDLGDLGAANKKRRRRGARRRRDAGWSEQGIDAQIRAMTELANKLRRHSENAKRRGHTAHARALDEMSDLAAKEAARLRRRDAAAIQTRDNSGDSDEDLGNLAGITDTLQMKVLGLPLWAIGGAAAAAYVVMRRKK